MLMYHAVLPAYVDVPRSVTTASVTCMFKHQCYLYMYVKVVPVLCLLTKYVEQFCEVGVKLPMVFFL